MTILDDYINSYDFLDPGMVLDDKTKLALGIVIILLGCVLIWIGYQRYKIQKEFERSSQPVDKKNRKFKW